MQQNKVIIICGQRGSGKTTLTKQIIEKHNSIYLFDINKEQSYLSIKNKAAGITDFKKFVEGTKNLENSFIIFEEATIFFNYGRTADEVTQLMVQARHRKLNLIFVFHSLLSLPTHLTSLADYILLKRTKDNPTTIERKFKDYEEIKAAFYALRDNPDIYATEIIEL